MKNYKNIQSGILIILIILNVISCPDTAFDSSQKAITAFRFTLAANQDKGLTQDVIGVIDGYTITLKVPIGTDLNHLVATFSTTGSSVSFNNMSQVSGVSPNTFTEDKITIYTVTALDGSSQQYGIIVTMIPRDAAPTAPFLGTIIPGDGKMTVYWTQPLSLGIMNGEVSANIRYKIYAEVEDITDNHNPRITVENPEILSAEITGLDNDELYTVALKTINDIGESSFSNTRTTVPSTTPPANSVPGAPILDDIVIVNGDEVTIYWRAPADTGIQDGKKIEILNYTLSITNEAGQVQEYTLPADKLFTIRTDLIHEEIYSIRVSAVNKVGAGAPSSVKKIKIPPEDSQPNPPTSLNGTVDTTMKTLTITWLEPENTGFYLGKEASITSFNIYYTPDTTAGLADRITTKADSAGGTKTPTPFKQFIVTGTPTNNPRSLTISGLVEGESYTLGVTAVTQQGESNLSTPIEVQF